jgi:hypothetical protein
MPNLLVDLGLILVPIGTSLTATQAYPGIAAPVWQAEPIAWVIAVSSVNNGPTYTFTLEWSATQGGAYTPMATFVLPSPTSPANFYQGVNGNMALSMTARWLRLNVNIGGGGRSVVFGSGLTAIRTLPGLGARAGDILAAV